MPAMTANPFDEDRQQRAQEGTHTGRTMEWERSALRAFTVQPEIEERIMDYTHDTETEKTCLKLQEFCDMNQLFSLLDNWSKSCGMATMIVDAEGKQLSENFGMTEFCRMVKSREKGLACCMETWKWNLDGVYECPFGLWDFSL